MSAVCQAAVAEAPGLVLGHGPPMATSHPATSFAEGDAVTTPKGNGIVRKCQGSRVRVEHEGGATNWIELSGVQRLASTTTTMDAKLHQYSPSPPYCNFGMLTCLECKSSSDVFCGTCQRCKRCCNGQPKATGTTIDKAAEHEQIQQKAVERKAAEQKASDETLQMLLQLGFTEEQFEVAKAAAHGSSQAAAESLFNSLPDQEAADDRSRHMDTFPLAQTLSAKHPRRCCKACA